jgi:hypothetical protein
MKQKVYIVSESTTLVGILSYDYLPWNSFTNIKQAKRYLKKAKDLYIRQPKIYKVNVKEIK